MRSRRKIRLLGCIKKGYTKINLFPDIMYLEGEKLRISNTIKQSFDRIFHYLVLITGFLFSSFTTHGGRK